MNVIIIFAAIRRNVDAMMRIGALATDNVWSSRIRVGPIGDAENQ